MNYKTMTLPTVTESNLSAVEKIVNNTVGATKADQIRALNQLKVSHGDTSKLLHVSNQHVRNTVKPWCEKNGIEYKTYSTKGSKGGTKTPADLTDLFKLDDVDADATSLI